MKNLNNKQKIIIIIILIVMIITIFYYFISQDNTQMDYSSFENIQENIINNISEINETENNTIVVHVAGSVKKPGVITLNYGSRIIDAIEKAGGTTEDAVLDEVNLAYILEDAQKLYIPNKNDSLDKDSIISSDNGQDIVEEVNNSLSSNLKININTATQTELELLPGIGSSIALKIINYRNEHGKFSSVDDIKNVSGVGEQKFNNIKDFIFTK